MYLVGSEKCEEGGNCLRSLCYILVVRVHFFTPINLKNVGQVINFFVDNIGFLRRHKKEKMRE
jgi:hypothetical protein